MDHVLLTSDASFIAVAPDHVPLLVFGIGVVMRAQQVQMYVVHIDAMMGVPDPSRILERIQKVCSFSASPSGE